MKKLDNHTIKQLYGGGISASLVSSLFRGLNIFVDLGRYFGSSVRRLTTRNICR